MDAAQLAAQIGSCAYKTTKAVLPEACLRGTLMWFESGVILFNVCYKTGGYSTRLLAGYAEQG